MSNRSKRKELIAYIQKAVDDKDTRNRIAQFLKETEPEMFAAMQKATFSSLAHLQHRGLAFYHETGDVMGGLFMKSFLQGYLMSMLANQELWENTFLMNLLDSGAGAVEDIAQKYQAWLDGRLSPEYYENVTIDPNNPADEDKTKAVTNYKKRIAEIEEKRNAEAEKARKQLTLAAVEKTSGGTTEGMPEGVTKTVTRRRKLTDGLGSVGGTKEE